MCVPETGPPMTVVALGHPPHPKKKKIKYLNTLAIERLEREV